MTTSSYRPSGQVPVRGICIVILFAMAAIPLARLYAWASFEAGFGLGSLIVVAMVPCLMLVIRHAAGHAKIRHPGWMKRAGAGFGGFVWYVQWAAWLGDAGAEQTMLDFATHPWEMAAAIATRAAGMPASQASFMLVCWLAELALFVLPCASVAALRAREPFCEAIGEWAEKVDVPVQFESIGDPEGARLRLESDPRQLEAILRPCPDDAQAFAELILYRCRGGDAFVTITNYVTAAPGSDAHREAAQLIHMPEDKVEAVFQADEPVVELLRLPMQDTDLLIREWKAAARSLSLRAHQGLAD